MSHADDPDELAGRIAEGMGGARPLIALDHDGTLAPIAPRPEDARLARGASDAVAALTSVADVVIVSGRGLEDLIERFRDLPVALVSEHGLRHRTVGGEVSWLVDPVPAPALELLRTELAAVLPATAHRAGWIVEDKEVSIAVHHRLVPADDLQPTLSHVRAALGRAADAGGHVQEGKAVLELRPAGADKGAALRTLSVGRARGALVMVGDDLTDEPALALAESSGGFGVLVAEEPRTSSASARVTRPEEVVRLLGSLASALRRGR